MVRAAGPEVVRYATRGVRFPRLIGRTLDGTRLWGGPYTVTQVIGVVCVFVVGALLRPVWGSSGQMISDYLFLLSVTAGVGYVLRWVPAGGRSPWNLARSLFQMFRTPRHGRLDGQRVRAPRATRVSGSLMPLLIPLPDQDRRRRAGRHFPEHAGEVAAVATARQALIQDSRPSAALSGAVGADTFAGSTLTRVGRLLAAVAELDVPAGAVSSAASIPFDDEES